ncbi:cysteine sulfinate desulfinase [Edwardsiella hoshinae]|uniref:cysteine desulfurase n=1 Tax=Edwardsiella hoshinae TaxID=93378 RepID=A0A376DJN0_9GAMM|nr:cysteine desulfurase CsdA [Edwardsiella hoshinae]AOV97764.1 cysteine sulfinate desulfinase [Edwardsiella hoshinae]QPR29351.1 cysteine desulfurase CsdA [Edwardsiella hoshinae]STC90704.1 Cysteine sulfinate desulfinase [Edwardsiella hoshinae]
MTFDFMALRRDFPALETEGVYLDSAATALKPRALLETLHHYYATEGATVHRSQHAAARRLTERFEQARQQVATLLGVDTQEIVWSKGATEAINLVAQSYLRPRLQPGDEILVSEAEHHANLIPWLMVAEQCQARVVKLPVDRRGLPDLTQLPALLGPRTRLLALGQMSNVTGGCPDLALAIAQAHACGCVVLIDGAQGIVHHPLDLHTADIDFYAFSAHKLYGPCGLGVLYGKRALLDSMHAWQGGGKMLTHADFSGFSEQCVPHRFEAGTPNIAGVLGFAAVLDWLSGLDRQAAERHCVQLAQQAETALSALPGFISYRAPGSPLLAFNFVDVHHSDLNTLVAEQGVALRSGAHCAAPLMQALGVSGTLRASFAPYNTPDDVHALLQAVRRALSLLTEDPR